MTSSPPDRASGRSDYFGVSVIYALAAMGAYQALSIPLEWIGAALSVLFASAALVHNEKYPRITVYPLVLILCVFFSSLIGWLWSEQSLDFQHIFPPGATTTYPVFIFLRYFQFVVFIAVYLVTVRFLKTNGFEQLAHLLVVCGVVISIYALYVYLAQTTGLPEIPRNRIGTGGEEQAVFFTYAFHRAMGPFREPSHLAIWLIIPLFMAFLKQSLFYKLARLLILSVILLTGSLTGIAAIIFGYVFSLFTTLPLRRALTSVLAFGTLILVATAIFTLFALPNPGGSANYWTVIFERVWPILSGGGMGASNRDYVYAFISTHPIPLVGYGLGNGNILFGDDQGLGLMGSFVSFYVNMLYSLGYIGTIAIVIFLLIPLVSLFRLRSSNLRHLQPLVAAYAGWLIVFSVLSEELTVSFAILYAICIHWHLMQKSAQRIPLGSPAHLEQNAVKPFSGY